MKIALNVTRNNQEREKFLMHLKSSERRKSTETSTVELFFSLPTRSTLLFRMIDNNFSSRKFLPCLLTHSSRGKENLYKYFQHIIPFIYFRVFLSRTDYLFFLYSASVSPLSAHVFTQYLSQYLTRLLLRMSRWRQQNKANFSNCLQLLVNIYLWWKSAKVITPAQQLTRFSL